MSTETVVTFMDGASWTETATETLSRGHHTAIVNGMPDAQGVVATLEQHVKPKGKVVQNKTLHTRDIPMVVTTMTEQRKHPSTKKMETAKVVTKVTVKVKGISRAYRPKPK